MMKGFALNDPAQESIGTPELDESLNRALGLLGQIRGEIHVLSDYGEKIRATYVERTSDIKAIVQANSEISRKIAHQETAADRCSELSGVFQHYFGEMTQSSAALAQSAARATEISELSEASIKELFAANQSTQQQFLHIVEKVAVLVEKAENINSIISVIIRIARQTNLLSINASIEAARAGQAGKGFAVVAEEIKRLANETQHEGESISSLIAGITSEIKNVQALSENARQDFVRQDSCISSSNAALTDIHNAIGELVDQQGQICSDVENLVSCKNELVRAIDEIALLTEQTAAISQMVSSISTETASRDGLGLSMVGTQQRLIKDLACSLVAYETCENAQRRLKIGFSSLEQQSFYDEVEEAARMTGSKLNMEVICRSPKRFDVDEQVRIFNSFIAEKVDGIIIVPADAARFGSLIDTASQQGIPVACIDIDVPKSRRDIYITSDSYAGGRLAGESAIRHLKGSGRIAALLCASQVPTVQDRFRGFQDAIAHCPAMTVVRKAEQPDTDLGKTRQLLEEIIRKGDFDLLYLVNSDAGEIAAELWRRKNLKKKLVVLSKSGAITAAVKEGIISSQIIQRNTLWGEMSILRLNQLLSGEQATPYENTGMYEINQINLPVFEKYSR